MLKISFKKAFASILFMLAMLAAVFSLSVLSSSSASAAAAPINCLLGNSSTYLNVPLISYSDITDYGTGYPNYTNAPSVIYAKQAITFDLKATPKSGYKIITSMPLSGTKTFSSSGRQDFTRTHNITVGSTSDKNFSCTVKVTWTSQIFDVKSPQNLNIHVYLGGKKQFGVAGSSVVKFSVNDGNSGDPLPDGMMYYSLNGTRVPITVPIVAGKGSVSLDNIYLNFNLFDNCHVNWIEGNIFQGNLQFNVTRCDSRWYRGGAYNAKANESTTGINYVDTFYFSSSNSNIWNDTSLNPSSWWFTASNVFKWQVQGPQDIPISKIWSTGVANLKANPSIEGATYAGYKTFPNSAFSTPSTNGKWSPTAAVETCTNDCPNTLLKVTNTGILGSAHVDYLPLSANVSGSGGRTYLVNSNNRATDTYPFMNSLYVLSCPVNATGIKIRYVDYGQSHWDWAQVTTMKKNQDSIDFQVNTYDNGFGLAAVWQKYINGPYTVDGRIDTNLPYRTGDEPSPDFYDVLHQMSGQIYGASIGAAGSWGYYASADNPPAGLADGWSCLMPSTGSAGPVDINFKIKPTSTDGRIAAYTSGQSPKLQNLKLISVKRPNNKIFTNPSSITVKIYKNNGTERRPSKGTYMGRSYDTKVNCKALLYGGSTRALPAAKYSLATGDQVNTCNKDISLHSTLPAGKYLAIVTWDGKEGQYQSYAATDSWNQSSAATSGMTFDIVQEFACHFGNTAAESIWVSYYDSHGTLITSKGAAATIPRSGSFMKLTYPNVTSANVVGMVYGSNPSLDGKIEAVTTIYDSTDANGNVILSTPREPEEVRLYEYDKSEILRAGTSGADLYTFGDGVYIGRNTASSSGSTDPLFHNFLRVLWPSTVINPSNNQRAPLILERKISIYGSAWQSGGGQMKLVKGWHTCTDNPLSGPLTIISSQVNQ